jgi:hypothetical protein
MWLFVVYNLVCICLNRTLINVPRFEIGPARSLFEREINERVCSMIDMSVARWPDYKSVRPDLWPDLCLNERLTRESVV